jgi:hypothetical protein
MWRRPVLQATQVANRRGPVYRGLPHINGWVGQSTTPDTDQLAEYAESVPTWLLGHGESAANAAGILAGQCIDSPLTVAGRAQARDAAASVPSDVAWIASSPLFR